MNKTKRNPTTVDIIAKKFKVKPSYVRSILKIGRVKPLNFIRMREGRMSVYAAYNDAKKEEKGDMPEVPKVKEVVYYQTSSHNVGDIQYSSSTTLENNSNTSVSEYDQAFSQDGICTTLVDGGEPTSDLKQVKLRPIGKKHGSDTSKDYSALQRIDEERIRFVCPCGCQTNIIINHKTLNYEKG